MNAESMADSEGYALQYFGYGEGEGGRFTHFLHTWARIARDLTDVGLSALP